MVKWNEKVKLIISDVDETIADLYVKADSDMIVELIKLLEEGKKLFFISGQSVKSISWRIVDYIPADLRKSILIGHCSGCEVWGFNSEGQLNEEPFYSCYEEALSEKQKTKWRDIIDELVAKFNLSKFDTMPIREFEKLSKCNPLAIMLEDRGPQITFEVVNGYTLNQVVQKSLNKEFDFTTSDLRDPIIREAEILLRKNNIPIVPKKAGVFAIDFVVQGVSKTTAIRHIIGDSALISSFGIDNIDNPEYFEIWGDKFSVTKGGTDRHMSEGLNKNVRSITFRKEDPSDFLEGYNIVVWDGAEELHKGALEYLKRRVDLGSPRAL